MKRWHFWVGLVISAIFLFFALRGLQIDTIWEGIKSSRLIWLIPGILVYFIALWMRSLRWRTLLQPMEDIPTRKIFPIMSIGYMGNNIFPARAGEFIRAVILKKGYKISVSASLATIVIERIFDGIAMLGFIILNGSALGAVSTVSELNQTISKVTGWGSLLFFSILIIFLLAAFFPDTSQKISSGIISKITPVKIQGKILSLIEKFFSGIQSLSSALKIFEILLDTVVIWMLETLFYWFIMNSFPIDVPFSILMLLNGAVNLITIIPSSPGYIGTFDAVGIAILTAIGINPEISASYILFLHAVLWLPVTLVGGIFFSKLGLDWSRDIDELKKEKQS